MEEYDNADESRLHQMVAEWLMYNMDNTSDVLIKNKIREPLQYIYPLFIFLHAVVAVIAISGNVMVLVVVIRRRLYEDPTFFLLGNSAVSDIIKALFVMPLTLTNLLIKHWVFGSFLCYFIPMLQSFPVYVSMLTYLVIAIDRYRLIIHPMKSRIPAGLTIIGTWVLSICIVLPQAIYLQYFDLGQISPSFDGFGICLVSIEKNYEEYVRSMFVILYAMPLATISFLYIRSSAELKSLYRDSMAYYQTARLEEDPISISPSEGSYFDKITLTTGAADDERRVDPDGASCSTSNHREYQDRHRNQVEEGDLDIPKEKRTQKYVITMTFMFAACWCPLNILYLVTPFLVPEETEAHMDITFITFSWIGFLSTCSTPILFCNWRLSSSTKARLREYFNYNRRHSSASSACHLNTHNTPSRSTDSKSFRSISALDSR